MPCLPVDVVATDVVALRKLDGNQSDPVACMEPAGRTVVQEASPPNDLCNTFVMSSICRTVFFGALRVEL